MAHLTNSLLYVFVVFDFLLYVLLETFFVSKFSTELLMTIVVHFGSVLLLQIKKNGPFLRLLIFIPRICRNVALIHSLSTNLRLPTTYVRIAYLF